MPEGIDGLPGPALALSLPYNSKDTGKNFIEALCQAASTIPEMRVFGGYASTQQILEAYSENRLPHMHLLEGKDEILVMSNEVNFFSYCGFYYSVKTLSVLAAETMTKRAVSFVEARVRDPEENRDVSDFKGENSGTIREGFFWIKKEKVKVVQTAQLLITSFVSEKNERQNEYYKNEDRCTSVRYTSPGHADDPPYSIRDDSTDYGYVPFSI